MSGQGSIRERAPGHFELRAYNKASGRQVTRTYRSPREEPGAGIREARRELARLVAEIDAGQHGGQRATVAQLLDEWLRHCASRDRSPTTLYGYESEVRRIKAGPLAKKVLSKLTAHDIDDYYAQLRAEGVSAATVLHFHRTLRAALNQAEKWGWVSRNVARQASAPSATAPEMNVPTLEQARALVLKAAETTSPDLGPIVLFAMLTGVRRGELCGLQWGDVNWESGRMTIRRSVWQRAHVGVKDPKTHQIRRLALDPIGMELLSARRARAEAEAEMAGATLGDDAFVWSTAVDGHSPRTPNSITRAFHRLCLTMAAEAKTAGRTEAWNFRLHDLRHLSATELVGQGVDIRTVAGRLGHADASVTLRVYAHVIEARDREAAEGLGRAFALPAKA